MCQLTFLCIVGANLHRESVRIQNMETEAASLLINRSGSSRLEIGGHGLLVEVVDSDRKVIHFGCGFTLTQDQKVFTKHELVVPVPFVHGATEHALVEIGRALQIAHLERDVIDAIALESSSLSGTGSSRQHRQALNQLAP